MKKQLLINFFDDRPEERNLIKLLDILKENDLEIIKYFYDIKKDMTKDEIIKYVYSKLTNQTFLSNLLMSFLPDEIEIIKKVIKANGHMIIKEKDLLDFSYLTSLFIIDTIKNKDELIIYMTDDVYNIIKKLDINKLDNSKINLRVMNLLFAMVNYYGVVSLDDLAKTYEDYYKEKLEINDALFSLEYRSENISYYNKDEEYFINSGFYEFDESFVELVIKRQKEFERPKIELEELLKYTDFYYIDKNEPTLEYYEFLKGKIEDTIIDDIVAYTQNSLKYSINEIYTIADSLTECGIKFSEPNLYVFMNIITKMYDLSKIYLNNGWQSLAFMKEYGKKDYIDLLEFKEEIPHECSDQCDCHDHHENEKE